MSAWHSAEDAAVAGLVAAAQTVTGPDVHDSLVVTASSALEAIVVAGTADPGQARDQHYIEQQLPEPGYTQDAMGQFVVYSEIAVLNGDANIAAARARAYQILNLWGQAIAADPTLGTAVMQSWISEVGYLPQQTSAGAKVTLLVAVTCEAFTDA